MARMTQGLRNRINPVDRFKVCLCTVQCLEARTLSGLHRHKKILNVPLLHTFDFPPATRNTKLGLLENVLLAIPIASRLSIIPQRLKLVHPDITSP